MLRRAVARPAEPVMAADEAPLAPAVEPGERDDLVDPEPGDLRSPGGRPRPEVRRQLVRSVRVPPHVRPVRVALGEEDVHHGARERPVGARAKGQVHVGALRRARPVGIHHDQLGAPPLRARDVSHDVDLGVDGIPAPDHDELRVLAHLAEVHTALGADPRQPARVRQGDADRRVPARVAHDVAQAVDAVPLDQSHRARVEVRPDRLETVAGRLLDERLRDAVQRLLPRDASELARALRPHAPQRVEQAVRVVNALRVAPHLLADDAGRVGVPRGAAHPPDRAGVQTLHVEGARARAVVRTHRGHELDGRPRPARIPDRSCACDRGYRPGPGSDNHGSAGIVAAGASTASLARGESSQRRAR